MRISQHSLIGLIMVVFVCGTVGLVVSPPSQAAFLEKKSFSQAGPIKKFFKKTVCGFENPGARFVTSKDGTEVCDRTTGYVWEQNPDSINRGTMTHANAIAFCANLDKGQGQVYELPSLQQLVGMLDYTHIDPALTPGVYSNVHAGTYWSATGLAEAPMSAWYVSVFNGDVDYLNTGPTFRRMVWCVSRDKDAHLAW